MILPIYTLGDAVLRQKAELVTGVDKNLDKLIKDMFETMYQADGIGLAAPQVGQSLDLLVVDISVTKEGRDTLPMVFINPEFIDKQGSCSMEEGCLSVPGINDFVERPEIITVRFRDEHFNERIETFDGMSARVIQHEYDHLQGTLFVDYLSAFRKTLLKNRIRDIQKGTVEVDYLLAEK